MVSSSEMSWSSQRVAAHFPRGEGAATRRLELKWLLTQMENRVTESVQ